MAKKYYETDRKQIKGKKQITEKPKPKPKSAKKVNFWGSVGR